MIVTCPNCQTRYNLPDEKIPAGGAKVKCSKCAHVFKAELPPATPEEEVESLLEDDSQAKETKAGDDFEETFDDVVSSVEEQPASAPEPPVGEPAEESVEEEGMPDMDDLFDAGEDAAPSPDEGPAPEEEDSVFGGDTDDLFAEPGEGDSDDTSGLFDEEEDEEDTGDLFDDSGDDDTGGFFEEGEEGEEEEDEDEDEDNELSFASSPKKGVISPMKQEITTS